MNKDVDLLIEGLSGEGKKYTRLFVDYMRKNHPKLEEVVSFQMPTYKLGSGKDRNYIAMSTAAKHYSLHTMDFDYINILREKLTKSGKGKGCVNVLYESTEEFEILKLAIEEIIKRNN